MLPKPQSKFIDSDNPYFKEFTEEWRHKLSGKTWKDQYLGEWEMTMKPRIVCLCGSTRFYEEFQKANFIETMAGNIVLTVGFYPHAKFSKKVHGEDVGITKEEKRALDELHKRKIDLADEILVLNVGGYYGESTASEIEHARKLGKLIRWVEPDKAFKRLG